TADGEDIQGRHEIVIEGEKGHNRRKNRGITTACGRQCHDHKQVDNRNVGNARVELEGKDDCCYQQGSRASQHAIEPITEPADPSIHSGGQNRFNSAHTGATFPRGSGVENERGWLSDADAHAALNRNRPISKQEYMSKILKMSTGYAG